MKKILEYFLKTRNYILTKQKFSSCPLCKKIWLELGTSQNKDNFLLQESFLTKQKYFLF